MTYDLYVAGAYFPVAGERRGAGGRGADHGPSARPTPALPVVDAEAYLDDGPRPPALLWGWAWRLLLVEGSSVALSGNLTAALPSATLPLTFLALASWGVPSRLWGRWGGAGAVWRVLTAAAVVAAFAGHRGVGVPLVAAGLLCAVEPPAQRIRRWWLAR